MVLVRDVQGEFGLQAPLAVLGLSRSTWHYQTRRRVSYALTGVKDNTVSTLDFVVRRTSG